MAPSFVFEVSPTSLHILNSTLPADLSVSDGTAWAKSAFVSFLSAVWAYFLSFLQSAFDLAGTMTHEIISQMIGTSLMGLIIYRYRDQLKDIINDVVNAAGAAVPEHWIDEEALVDLIEDAAGIDTPSGSEEEEENAPLIPKETGMKVVTVKRPASAEDGYL